ncbi:MAG: hypothetical protein CSA07_05075 [Bacteroidia bacterium]|nr:MAG: hypothetical protein CSA07_05075 [Bacteroidia bacterium]
MKKAIVAICALLALGGAVRAQAVSDTLKSAPRRMDGPSAEYKGTKYFPRAGHIGLGINAMPIFNLMGSVFHEKAMAPTDYGIYGRYFLTDFTALRMRADANFGTTETTSRTVVNDDLAASKGHLGVVEDLRIVRKSGYQFRMGYMAFRGQDRFRAFLGGDVYYRFDHTVTEFKYGNAMNVKNLNPTTHNFDASDPNVLAPAPATKRLLYRNGGQQHTMGLSGFAGVEFYFIPRASIGFEVGLNLGATLSTRGEVHTEEIRDKTYFKQEVVGGKEESISFASKSPGFANFFVMFHF